MTPILLGIFELIKGIAWPLVCLAIAVAYKPEILPSLPKWISRSWSISIPGFGKIEAGAAGQQKEITNDPSNPTLNQLVEIPGLPRTDAIASIERTIFSQLKNVTAEQTAVLVRNLAQAQLEASFGITYSLVYGTQISALALLEARRVVTTAEAQQFYEQFVAIRFAAFYEGYGFPGWLSFLVNRGLVQHVAETLSTTDVGLDFLKWMKAKELPTRKPW